MYLFVAATLTLCSLMPLSSCQITDMPNLANLVQQFHQTQLQSSDHAYMNEAVEIYEKLKNLDPQELLAKVNDVDVVPSQCYNDSAAAIAALAKLELPALYMFDSMGKPPTGILQGLFNWMGSYEECLGVTLTTSNTTQFTGRYCNMQVGAVGPAPPLGQLPKSVTVGVCIPSSCSVYEIEYYINLALAMISVPKSIQAFGGWCQPLDPEIPPMNAGSKVMIVIFSVLAVLLVLGTLYDVCIVQRRESNARELCAIHSQMSPEQQQQHQADVVDLSAEVNVATYTPLMNSHPDATAAAQAQYGGNHTAAAVEIGCSILLAFSVVRNIGKLLHVPPAGEGNLTVIHGIRFLSMTWVILGHTFAFILTFVQNPTFGATLFKRWTFQAISNATLSVDTFFLLSGTLVAYLLLKEMDKNGWNLRLGWIMFYVHRYWRLTAPYILVVGFWTTLYQYTGDGPNWPPGNSISGACNETWWTNLLYVNNVVQQDKQCMGWAWYLANDMQFFVISPLFLIPLYLWWPVGGAITFSVMLLSFGVSGYVSVQNNMGIGLLGGNQDVKWFNNYYIVPWCRIGPYLVGLMLGWALWKTKLNCKMHWTVAALGWAVAATCALAIVYGPYSQMNGHTASLPVAGLYNATTRTVWGACVAWLIFACINGYGGLVNSILSWPALVPLSRLTYMAYLVHPAVIYNYYLTRRTFIYIDDFQIIYLFLAHLVMSYLVALVVSLALESPLMGIERALRRKDRK